MDTAINPLINRVIEKAKAAGISSTTIKPREYNCPICQDNGAVTYLKNGFLYSDQCECEIKRQNLKRIERSGLKELLDKCTFDSFVTDEPWQANIKAIAQNFASAPKGHWFVIAGTPGTGKTHICTAISGELIDRGYEVRYMLWRDNAREIKALVNDNKAYNSALNPLKTVDVLYIDDLFKGGVKDGDINLAFELLNARYNSSGSITIISSERTIPELLELDEAIGSRIYERSKGFCLKAPKDNLRIISRSGSDT